jgi:metal-sulfur cluster biosynthetic enzyme
MGEPPTDDAIRFGALSALRDVVDPEIGLSILELGLVYGIDVAGGNIRVRLTMTSPACPLGEQIVRDAEARLQAIEGAAGVRVELVWDPPWSPERMSAAAKELLGWHRP